MKTFTAIAALLLCLSFVSADSETLRLDGVSGHKQLTSFTQFDGWEVWSFNITGENAKWRLGRVVGKVGTTSVKLLGAFVPDIDVWSFQVESFSAFNAGNARLTACLGLNLPIGDGNDLCFYTPGIDAMWSAGNKISVGAAGTFSWPSGNDFSWNAGPQVSLRVSDRVSLTYRYTFLGNGNQDDQLKCAFSW